MKKVIITGSNGFLGNALAEKLLNMNVYVYGITSSKKDSPLEKYPNYENIVATFDQYDNVLNKITNQDIDVLFHCAWQGTTSKEYQDFNVQINNLNIIPKLIGLMKNNNCKKCIFIGSGYQYKMLSKENNEYVDNIYGVIKQSCEELLKLECTKNNIKYNNVLFTTLYGVGDNSNRLINTMITKAINKESPELIEGNNLYDFLYIDDAVDGIMAICNKGKNLTSYYIGSRNLCKFKEMISKLFNTIDDNLKLEFGVFVDNSYIDYSKIDLDKLYNDTGFECKSDFCENIIKTMKWLKEN